ncbi:MAG TPA: methyltransferase domain-containing protein [Planctomycetota bacterium]|nr:methyltransferase domain-containing protein [Planctomycetota bacterium]
MRTGGSDASAKWLAAGSGAHYSGARFRGARARERDSACLVALLERVRGPTRAGRLLDVPCGSGRLTRALAERAELYLGVDVSRDMLQQARPVFTELVERGARACAVEADARALPFPAGRFDVVVACRFLHHLHEESALRAAIAELTRVSSDVVIASFWDERSLPGWRRKLGLKRAEGLLGRRATTRERIAELFDEAGADVVAWRATLRYVAQQTFVAARVRRIRP